MAFDTVEEVEKITEEEWKEPYYSKIFCSKGYEWSRRVLSWNSIIFIFLPTGAVAGEVDNSTIISVGIYALSISTCLWLLALFIFPKLK